MFKTDSSVIRQKYFSSSLTTAQLADVSKLSLSTIKRLIARDCCVKHCTAKRVFNFFGQDAVKNFSDAF